MLAASASDVHIVGRWNCIKYNIFFSRKIMRTLVRESQCTHHSLLINLMLGRGSSELPTWIHSNISMSMGNHCQKSGTQACMRGVQVCLFHKLGRPFSSSEDERIPEEREFYRIFTLPKVLVISSKQGRA